MKENAFSKVAQSGHTGGGVIVVNVLALYYLVRSVLIPLMATVFTLKTAGKEVCVEDHYSPSDDSMATLSWPRSSVVEEMTGKFLVKSPLHST